MASVSDQANALESQRGLFEIPEGVTYLNCASMSPQLRSVTAAGMDAVRAKASPWTVAPPDWFSAPEHLRALAAQVMGADAEGVALVSSASYGIAVAAANVAVRRGQSIVLLDEQFPSNVYAWRELARRHEARIRTVRRDPDGTWTEAVLRAIDEETAVVAVPNCHWTDGSLVDLVRVGAKARLVGAALVVDASQSLGVYPLDVSEIRPDFLISVGYKWLLGPYGLGDLYVAPQWRETGTPLENSWLSRAGSENFARLVEYTDEYRVGARRFDMGEFPQFVLAPMAIAALEQIVTWGVEGVQSSLSLLTRRAEQTTAELGGATLRAEHRVGHMIGIRLRGGIPHGLGPAFAVLLFTRVDVLGVAWLRIASAAAVFAIWRRPWRGLGGLDARGRRTLVAWGGVLAVMNVCFYIAIDRLPLGTVAAIEFLPVIGLAALGTRTARNGLALACAVAGVYLLTGFHIEGEPIGLAFAFANAVLFALYIVLGHHVAQRGHMGGIDGLAASMLIAAVFVTPVGGWGAAPALLDPIALGAGIAVGITSSVIPYVCDQLAMARMSRATYALLVSLLPAIATIVGVVVLAQIPSWMEAVGVGLVVVGVATRHESGSDASSRPESRTARSDEGGTRRPDSC